MCGRVLTAGKGWKTKNKQWYDKNSKLVATLYKTGLLTDKNGNTVTTFTLTADEGSIPAGSDVIVSLTMPFPQNSNNVVKDLNLIPEDLISFRYCQNTPQAIIDIFS